MKLGLQVGFGFLVYWGLRSIGVPLEIFLALGIALAIGWPLGWFIGTLIGEETDVDTAGYKAIGWANLVAWLFPIAGFAVATLTSTLGKESVRHRFFYDAMSFVGFALVYASAALYVPLVMSENAPLAMSDATQSTPPRDAAPRTSYDHLLTGERSFARCHYAAMEGWSKEELDVHCNREPTEEEMREFELEHERFLAAQS